MRKPRSVLPLCGLLLLVALAGCATGPTAEAALEGHEGVHGPPWAPNDTPWVAPPTYAADLAPYPYWYDPLYGPGWYGGGLALGFGLVGRPHFFHHHHGFHGGFRGFHHGGFHGGHRGGGRGGRR